ncbi:CMGC/MAPK protein kinase [Loa loa]|uniref:Mitogen-activated protein kinase n=1 Tax=Loa loa TaxID=7209 RepID=A0A1S0U1L4_LOALO|nr:CMGC/MAPK protein kinase [Loa loa]EFO23440.2 CMGC/MAPK protein kinase [Loa loa]
MAYMEQLLDVKFNLDNTPYKSIENIGTGAYGVVCKAYDQQNGKKVAIKKIMKAFSVAVLLKRSLREIRILRCLNHENIVSVHDVFIAPGLHGLDVYMVLDLMETDLHQIIHSRQDLTNQHYQYFLYQILRGLKYLHSVGIMHRDLKPSNLLVNSDCLLKIGDFGMARLAEQQLDDQNVLLNPNFMTQYVSTRWYRAPELLFSLIDYDTQVDIWSAGCIFAEMLLRRQLFPGKDAGSQVKIIIYYLGTPEKDVMERISSNIIIRWIESCGPKDPLPWTTIIPKANPQAVDLLKKLLIIAPWKRITAEQALCHQYLETYHDTGSEPNCPKKQYYVRQMIFLSRLMLSEIIKRKIEVYFDAGEIERLSIDQLECALLAEASGPYTQQSSIR